MKKKVKLAVICAAFLLVAGSTFAGETFSFKATCSIPAIPGVNAPLVEESATEETRSKDDNKDNGQNLEKTEEKSLVLVKTIYSK